MGERTRKKKNGKDAVPSKEVTAAHRYFVSYEDPGGKKRQYRFYTANPVFPVRHEVGAEEKIDGEKLVVALLKNESYSQMSLMFTRDDSFGKVFECMGEGINEEVGKVMSQDTNLLLDEIKLSGPISIKYEGKADVPTSKLNEKEALFFTRKWPKAKPKQKT